MCGITGILQAGADARGLAPIDAMRDALTHRGPDDKGTWIDTDGGRVALGHRRLSVVDLSPAGAQPMVSEDGRYVLAFNGEIYNFRTLRETLHGHGHTFRGTSDTEVALAAFLEWGIEESLRRFEGMFAIALWDKRDQCLYLARDRFGEKPLYYGMDRGTFLFGSELKSLRPHPDFNPEIDRDALTILLRHSYIPAPHCIFAHYHKLPPGSYLCVTCDLRSHGPTSYWSLESLSTAPYTDLPEKEAVDELERLLSDSIRDKMVADVPVGAFLSGGVDSTLVVSLMRQYSEQPIRTFTIGFHNTKLNEAQEAGFTAKFLGTDHQQLYVSDRELLDIVPRIPRIYDEPFADPSQIPTTLVSQLARQQVTVALSGDGGDELFAGYNRYGDILRRWKRARYTPRGIRGLQAGYLQLKAKVRRRKRTKYLQQSLMKRSADDLRLYYRNMMSYWGDPEAIVLNGKEPATPFLRDTPEDAAADPWRWLPATDALCYLPDDIMTKVDRAAMSTSLETRAPFLDSRIAAYAFTLPPHYKFRDGTPKWLLRQLLYRYVPADVVERPKRGFGVPLDEWLRGPLREWGEELLDVDRLENQQFFSPGSIRQTWNDHVRGNTNSMWPLWCVLMFQAWLDDFFA
ncbi:asparagine synthase [Salinisphaera sp. PC39]|uniref:asparagine synthase (glutamine-hydrolyzing) n=1 Tax=Salinisphaera sp. PC39 TaxID=1304156 RepID=UPI00333E6AA3